MALTVAIRPPEYFPRLPYLALMSVVDVFVVADTLPYARQGYQNRCRVRTAAEPSHMWLTLPVGGGAVGTPLLEVALAHQRWRGVHRKSFRHTLSSAPFWSHFEPEVEALLALEGERLVEVTIPTVEWAARAANAPARLQRASELDGRPDSVTDIARAVGATRLVTLPESATADRASAARADIDLSVLTITEQPRRQNFPGFVPNCGALDLLANHGPEAGRVLKSSLEQ